MSKQSRVIIAMSYLIPALFAIGTVANAIRGRFYPTLFGIAMTIFFLMEGAEERRKIARNRADQ